MIHTTKGLLSPEQVEMRPRIVHDTEYVRVTRTDKFLNETGEWVGNDLHVDIKKPLEMLPAQEQIG